VSKELSVGFIGLGNVGAKLAGSILKAGIGLTVLDLDSQAEAPLLAAGALKGANCGRYSMCPTGGGRRWRIS
jgi:3-hydroxyisobutyrate dehydrogenase-like beta-hydroxyacid dehydrogenase